MATSKKLRGKKGDGTQVLLRRCKYTGKGLLETEFRFQCAPLEEYQMGYAHEHADYMTLRAGQFSRPTGRTLRTVTFNTLFVDEAYVFPDPEVNWMTFDSRVARRPNYRKRQMEKLLNSGTPFYLIISNPRMWGGDDDQDVNMMVTLRTMNVTERAGEPDARYTDLSFTEYRAAEVKRQAKGKGRGKRGPAKRHTIRITKSTARDLTDSVDLRNPTNVTLQSLSTRYYGTASKARTIAQASGISWPNGEPLSDYVVKHGGKPLNVKIPVD